MSAPSGWVLGAAAVLTSPALYAALVDGTLPVDVAVTRFLLATAACWAAFSVAGSLFWPTPAPVPVPVEHQPGEPAE